MSSVPFRRLGQACPQVASGFRGQKLKLHGLRTEHHQLYHIPLAEAGHKVSSDSWGSVEGEIVSLENSCPPATSECDLIGNRIFALYNQVKVL